MEDQRTSNTFCINCGYSLRGLSEARCPECGRVFDPSKPKTMARTPRRAALRRWLGVPFLLMVVFIAYLAAYLILVQRAPAISNTFYMGGNPNVFYIRQTARISEKYRIGGEWSQRIFHPANWVDRHIREDFWIKYGCSDQYIPAVKVALRAISKGQPTLNKGAYLIDLIARAESLKPEAPQRKQIDKQIWDEVKKLQ